MAAARVDRCGRMERTIVQLTDIEGLNRNAASERDAFRAAVARGSCESEDHHKLKHRFPFYGHVPCRAGPVDFLMYSANDDVVAWEYFWTGGYEEPVVAAWLEMTRSAKQVLDVGAYSGCMSIVAALNNPSCHVHAFEAMPRTVERLSVNCKLNGVADKVTIHNLAVSDQDGTVLIHMPRPRDFLGTGNSIFHKPNVRMVDQLEVKSGPIAAALANAGADEAPVSCIKLDVEGHEMPALKGMVEIIERDRPSLIVEVWAHEKEELFAFFEALHYRREQLQGMNWLFVPRQHV